MYKINLSAEQVQQIAFEWYDAIAKAILETKEGGKDNEE